MVLWLTKPQDHEFCLRRHFWEKADHTFLGGLDCIVLAGKEIMGKSSVRVGGGEEVAGVLEAGVPFPPAWIKTARVRHPHQQRLHLFKPCLKIV